MIAPVYRSARTKEIYERALNQLRVAFKTPPNDFDFLQNSKEVIEHIEGLEKSVNSKKIYYIAIVSHLKGVKEFEAVYPAYKAKMDGYNAAVAKQMAEQQLSPAEQEKFISWPEVVAAREKIRTAAHDLMTYQDYVLVCLYTLIPPARVDYSPMHVVSEEPTGTTGNYLLVLPDGLTFIMNEYKTAHRYGQARVAVPKALEEVLREWLLLNPSGWLLCNSEGEPLTDIALSRRVIQIFQRHVGKPVGVCMLRHSFVSWVRKDEMPFREQAEIARSMGHSVGMSQMYRRL